MTVLVFYGLTSSLNPWVSYAWGPVNQIILYICGATFVTALVVSIWSGFE